MTMAPGKASARSASAASQEASLLRVSKVNKKTFDSFAEGVHLITVTGRQLVDLKHQACADRISLASDFLLAGDKFLP